MDPLETPEMSAIANARIAYINTAVSNFAQSVQTIAGQLHAQALSALSDLTPATAARAQALVELQRNLQGQLNKMDYEGKIQTFLGAYDASALSALETLKAMKVDSGRLAPLDTKALTSLKRMDYKFLADIGPAAIAAVSHGVVQNTLMGTPRSRIISNIKSTLDGKFASYASTYADTALSAYDRRVTMETWTQAGLKIFTYRGPKDVKNREFCAPKVGKQFTLPEIKAMNNGTKLMPVIVYGGGWNCRHIFVPIAQQPVEPRQAPPTPAQALATAKAAAEDLAMHQGLAQFASESARAVVKINQKYAGGAAFAAESGAAVIKINEQASLKAFAEESAAAVVKLNAEALAIAEAKAAKAAAEQAAAAKAAAEAKALADAAALAKKVALETEAALKKQLADAAAKLLAEQSAAKLAAELAAAAAKSLAEQKAVDDAVKLATAANPSQLIAKGTHPESGKATFTVQGKEYASAGAAHKFATKLFAAAHPDLVKAKVPKPAPAPPAPPPGPAAPPAPQKPAATPPAANNPAPAAKAPSAAHAIGKTKSAEFEGQMWDADEDGNFVSDDSGEFMTAFSAEKHFKAGAFVPSTMYGSKPGVGPSYNQWLAENGFAVPAEAPEPEPEPGPDRFTFKSVANIGGAHYKEIYTDGAGAEWLFKPVSHANDNFLVYADEAAFKIGKAVLGDVIEVRAAELGGKFGSLQRLETNLAAQKDFTRGNGAGNQPVAMTSLSASDVAHLQSEQVVDWLISNHDAHPSQFVRTAAGGVYGIDKTQAFKFLGQDKLSPDYHPNKVEVEPIYNPLMRAAKAGQIKLDPANALKAIRAAELISTAELTAYLKPLAESRWKGDAAAQQKFYDAVLARKAGIRGDFEKLYGDVLGKKNFQFEPPAKGAPAGSILDAPMYARASRVAAARGQGQQILWDKGDVEDTAVRFWEETLPDGKKRTMAQFKVRPEAQARVLKATGADLKAPVEDGGNPAVQTSVKVVSLGSQKGSVWHDGDGGVHTITAKSIFDKLVNGQAVTEWKYGHSAGGALSALAIAAVKAEAAAYLKAAAAAQAKLDKPAAPAPKASGKAEFRASVGTPKLDRKSNHEGGGIHVLQLDADFNSVAGIAPPKGFQQVNLAWDDGVKAKWTPHIPTKNKGEGKAYAHQGVFTLSVDGEATAANVEKALGKLTQLGIAPGVPTAADRELLYLHKAAYINKVDDSAEWKAAAAAGVDGMRGYWSKRLGVPDVTKLPSYKPEGVYEKQWDDPSQSAGRHLLHRFDLNLAANMKGYGIYHDPTYGGGSLEQLLDGALPRNGALISTMEKQRLGVQASGGSPTTDQHSGGASYAFTRIKKNDGLIKASGIHFKIDVLARMDAISYQQDKYGETIEGHPRQRAATPGEFKQYSERSDNETIFKGSLSLLDDVDFYKTAGPDQRKRVLAIFKANGITKMRDGRKIEDVVL